MVKRTLLLLALTAVLGTALPGRASAERCIMGRVTALTGTTITIYDKEKITFSVDNATQYTRWITNWRWQSSTQFHNGDLDIGRLVVIHSRHSDDNVARWVQVATDAY